MNNRPLRLPSLLTVLLFSISISASAQTDRQKEGLVDVQTLDSTLAVKMIYATPHNFTGRVLYQHTDRAYLRREVALKLIEAQRLLRLRHPGYRLIIFDAARPMSVQQQMWNVVKNTPQRNYVANPSKGGGLHNFGAAVDLSILDSTGNELPMGTPVDHLGPEAHITHEDSLVETGKITLNERNNRRLLRSIMIEAGFRTIPREWWHFNAYRREYAQKHLPLLP